MDNNKIQEQSKREALVRGEAFYRMVREDGWKFVKKYFESKLQAFATSMLVEGKSIEEYDAERHELVGLRKLFGLVDSDIKLLEDEQKSKSAPEK